MQAPIASMQEPKGGIRQVPRLRRGFVFLVIFIGGMGAAAPAFASQGGYHTGTTECDGSRASIQGSVTLTGTSLAIGSVRVQSSFTSNAGLIQAGHIKETSTFVSDCGAGTVGFFVERRPVGGTFRCNAFFGAFGSNQQFAVKHVSNGWVATLNGNNLDGPFGGLGFSQGRAFSVGEYLGIAPTAYSMTFGPSGSTAWQRLLSGSWTTVQSATFFNEGGWAVTALPSPFRIYR